MINKKFEGYKLQREIRRSGVTVTVERPEINEFKELTGAYLPVGSLQGLYHEESSYITVIVGDGTRSRVKKLPRLLCLFADVDRLKIQSQDRITLNGKPYDVTGITNVQEWNIVCDLSLEEFDVGT